ncbi:MAG: ABC transporter ATP-binding protein [Alphaproteobacteria bacterium]|nr:ABC transporter ATP-binding protein [Alphaproteobacteria bacterium]
MSDHLIELRDLRIATYERDLVKGVSFDVVSGKVTAVMGPSGSGKTLTARAVMGFIDVDPGLQEGSLRYPVLGADDWFEPVRQGGLRAQRKLLRRTASLRGSYLTYSPQAAASALNPGRTVGRQLEIAVSRRTDAASLTQADVAKAVQAALDEVGLPMSAANALPGELSGGQCQRAALAIAVAPRPRLVIADEPETGLDPVLTRTVIELMVRVCQDHGYGLMLISHHQETVDRIADTVIHLPGQGAR